MLHQPVRGFVTPDKLPAEAARLLLMRRRARESLVEFSMSVDIPGKPIGDEPEGDEHAADDWVFHPIETAVAAHHILIMNEVERCVNMRGGRLMLFFPPGSAKTTYGAVLATAYFMGKIPGFRVIATSYGTDLARKIGRRARHVARSKSFHGITGAHLSPDLSSMTEWSLTNGSEFMGGGILAGIGGNRAELLIIDDPLKGREAAESPTIRNKIRDEYDDTLSMRLVPGGSTILIMTRWHPDDLAGGILPEDWDGQSGDVMCRDGRVWRVIRVPGFADAKDDPLGRKIGEPLWPEWFDDSHWISAKKNLRTFTSLVQGLPKLRDGGFFLRDRFQYLTPAEVPPLVKIVRRWDLGATEGGGDPTAGVLAGITKSDDVVFLDAKSEQFGPGKAERFMREVAEQDDADWNGKVETVFPQEPGAAGKMLRRSLSQLVSEYAHGFELETRAKHIRARPLASGLESGRVFLRKGAWNDTFVAQLAAFDETIAEANGDQEDDFVDAASGAWNRLTGIRRRRGSSTPNVG